MTRTPTPERRSAMEPRERKQDDEARQLDERSEDTAPDEEEGFDPDDDALGRPVQLRP